MRRAGVSAIFAGWEWHRLDAALARAARTPAPIQCLSPTRRFEGVILRTGLVVEILEIVGGVIVIVLASIRIWGSMKSRSRQRADHVVDQQRQ